MGLTKHQAHLIVVMIGTIIAFFVYLFFSGEGSYSILFFDINKEKLAKSLSFISFGLYVRWCYEIPIPPNEQGIQLFFGEQTGEVWSESNFLFVPRPFWSIWKRLSIQHFSFTVATQNRTKEGHSVMVFATGRAVPNNAQLMAKITEEGMREQTLGLSMTAIGAYIRTNNRDTLLNFQNWNISEAVKNIFEENNFYGLNVTVFTTKVVEVSQETMRQFDILARQLDMSGTISKLQESFPGSTDLERYAMYASLVGINPAVMSYIVHGEGNNNVLIGGGRLSS